MKTRTGIWTHLMDLLEFSDASLRAIEESTTDDAIVEPRRSETSTNVVTRLLSFLFPYSFLDFKYLFPPLNFPLFLVIDLLRVSNHNTLHLNPHSTLLVVLSLVARRWLDSHFYRNILHYTITALICRDSALCFLRFQWRVRPFPTFPCHSLLHSVKSFL